MIVKKELLVVLIVVFLFSCKKDIENSTVGSSLELKDSLTAKTVLYNEDNLDFDYLPTSTTNQIVKHDYYTLSYNEKFEQAEWVAYELKKSYIKNNDFKRPYFIEDDKVTTGSADWRNYKQSGYDKGHLCPAGDMEFNKKAYEDTFLTSNISPQVHAFNDGVWNRLEQKVRYWAVKYDDIYVVTGGVLNDSNTTIGKEKVLVPKYFYKILLDESNGKYKMIAFLVPNEKSERPLYDFVVSVDSIEKLTGIDFFPHLDDKIEDALEKNTDYKSWIF
ncbi:DNA/RNA non-specific endonuclease [Flavobacterium sp. F-65]|uniref:DNA/RNA non-specific endonuclease n=1 Tax=Flavobacterium pisciphilum TaxID=2893755 RepID=A0ABS8MV46_9FLAO|nr:DNA/RNA non-specific endonuclease [Flavobacterium sp. F-65]MCC9071972.1 DNA/RNA non-specific endonuclease [Flavobacterium sp. F-65]